MKRLIAGSAALLGVIAVPAQAQSLGTIINSMLGGGYSNGYQQPYGYQPSYNYGYQPSYAYGYQPSYGYQRSYSYQHPYRYSRSRHGHRYNSYHGYAYQQPYAYRSYGYQQPYAYSRGRDYEHRRYESRGHRDENDDNQD